MWSSVNVYSVKWPMARYRSPVVGDIYSILSPLHLFPLRSFIESWGLSSEMSIVLERFESLPKLMSLVYLIPLPASINIPMLTWISGIDPCMLIGLLHHVVQRSQHGQVSICSPLVTLQCLFLMNMPKKGVDTEGKSSWQFSHQPALVGNPVI